MLEDLKKETIVEKVGGRFKLSTLIQKRLVALNAGSRALVEIDTDDKMQIAWTAQTKLASLAKLTNQPDYRTSIRAQYEKPRDCRWRIGRCRLLQISGDGERVSSG
jgi:DNA-directed RNA polymerase subunit omega